MNMSKLHAASEKGNLAEVTRLLQQDASLVHARLKEPGGDQPLHLAAWQGRRKVVEYLIDAGADVNAKGDSGRTPLHYAMQHDHPSVLKLLLKRGADPNVYDDLGYSVLFYAATHEYQAGLDKEKLLSSWLIKSGAKVDLNSLVYLEGGKVAAERLVQAPELLNLLPNPENLMSIAIHTQSLELVERLLKLGVSPSEGRRYADPPLIKAVMAGNVDILEALLRAGANIHAKDTHGRGVLKLAQRYRCSQELIDVLLANGAVD